jgi:pimeloyl-ACP methyl ester carboxylesterase
VILIHGFGANKDLGVIPLLFERLASRVSVVSIDLPAHGGSSGSFEEISIPSLDAALDSFIDANASGRSVVLIGHSMGGVLAYRAAARRADVVGFVLLAPGFEVISPFLLALEQRALDEGVALFTEAGREYRVSRAFFESRSFDPLTLTAMIDQPALIIIGDLDHTVGREACRTIATRLSHASFLLVEGEGHDLSALSYWSRLVSFVEEISARRGI